MSGSSGLALRSPLAILVVRCLLLIMKATVPTIPTHRRRHTAPATAPTMSLLSPPLLVLFPPVSLTDLLYIVNVNLKINHKMTTDGAWADILQLWYNVASPVAGDWRFD